MYARPYRVVYYSPTSPVTLDEEVVLEEEAVLAALRWCEEREGRGAAVFHDGQVIEECGSVPDH